MFKSSLPFWLCLVCWLALPASAQMAGTEVCLGCHEAGEDSPAHRLFASKHGDKSLTGSPMAEKGCVSCHGDSTAHSKAPLKVAPAVSFGPRWTAKIPEQNAPCLTCHEKKTASNWTASSHHKQNLTCITCHDIHTAKDPVVSGQQLQVCTTCHKPQKEGIHQLSKMLDKNPPCTQCHNPHKQALDAELFVKNRSEGCRTCHDLVAMNKDSAVSEKAKSYHRTMTQPDKSCFDCHKGIAHAPADSVAPTVNLAGNSRAIGLFFPGQHDFEWLTNEHKGAQNLRQGRTCLGCHVGEELNMAAAPTHPSVPNSRDMEVSLATAKNQLLVTFSWSGTAQDKSLAVMWNDGGNETFSQVGCWATCHSDLPGMSRDRSQGVSKYLEVSRAKMQRIGVPPQIKTDEQLAKLVAEGNYVTVQRVTLNGGDKPTLEQAQLLSQLSFEPVDAKPVKVTFKNGRWTVVLSRALPPSGKTFNFGLAIHGANGPGPGHWVSLPLTYERDQKGVHFVGQ